MFSQTRDQARDEVLNVSSNTNKEQEQTRALLHNNTVFLTSGATAAAAPWPLDSASVSAAPCDAAGEPN